MAYPRLFSCLVHLDQVQEGKLQLRKVTVTKLKVKFDKYKLIRSCRA